MAKRQSLQSVSQSLCILLALGSKGQICQSSMLTGDGPRRFAMPGDVNYRKLVVHADALMPLCSPRCGRGFTQEERALSIFVWGPPKESNVNISFGVARDTANVAAPP